MTTERLYFQDPYRLDFRARVVERIDGEHRDELVLDATCFYPTGGGQPHDLGVLAGAEVVDVRTEAGRIVHVLSGLSSDVRVGDDVEGRIDGERRADYRAQHHAQHMLSAAAHRLFGRTTVAVRLASQVCTVDLEGSFDEEQVRCIEELTNAVAREGRCVQVHMVPAEDVPGFGLRRPPKVQGTVRVVEVPDFDRAACGGTHPRTTAEIAPVKVVRVERVRSGHTRLHFLAGRRALEDYVTKDAIVRRAAAALSVHVEQLDDALSRQREELERMQSLARRRGGELMAARSATLLADAELVLDAPLVALQDDDLDGEERKLLARRVTAADARCVLVTREQDKLALTVAVPEGSRPGADQFLRALLEPFGGRGGGRPTLAQGACSDRSCGVTLIASAARVLEGLAG